MDDDRTPQKRPFRRLKKRAQFQRVLKGRRHFAPAFALQAAPRAAEEAENGAGVGFTVTKKVGNAVARNRIRRRLKAALAEIAPLEARADHDYVVVARREALTRGFQALIADLGVAFATLARGEKEGRRRGPMTPNEFTTSDKLKGGGSPAESKVRRS